MTEAPDPHRHDTPATADEVDGHGAADATTVPDRGRRTRAALIAGVIAVLIVALGVANLLGLFDSTPPRLDRADPAATATAFLQRYAVHDPAVCELVTATLRAQFERSGRCAGAPSGPAPRISVINSRTCGDRHTLEAEVTPAGQIGAPYVSVGLESSGGLWSLRSVLPISDRGVLRDTVCAPPPTSYGG